LQDYWLDLPEKLILTQAVLLVEKEQQGEVLEK
jgi:hypothetical protein